MENGFCILRIPYIISARGVWFTFIFRKQEHLAVGSWGRGLTDSRGSLPLGLPCPPLLYSYYSTDLSVCQEFFLKSSSLFSSAFAYTPCCRCLEPFGIVLVELENTPWNRTFVETSFRTPLCLYYSTLWKVCQEEFSLVSEGI